MYEQINIQISKPLIYYFFIFQRMNAKYKPQHQQIDFHFTGNNPQQIGKVKKQTSPQIFKRSNLNHRLTNPHSNHNICFISPKKIAYFKNIDQSCLGASEIKSIQQHGDPKDVCGLKLALNQKAIQIDYLSIKRCLSPRLNNKKADTTPQTMLKDDGLNINKYIARGQAEHNDIQFYRKLVDDLKQQVIQMSNIIQAKDQQIKEKDAKILQLQRDGFKEQISQINSQSLKELSTNFEERSSRLLQSFVYLNDDDRNDKFSQMEEMIKNYECKIKKQQIQIDILKNNKFDRVQMQKDLQSITKKHASMKKKVDRLVQKNMKLNKQLERMKYQTNCCNQRSFILQYSPQKPHNLS